MRASDFGPTIIDTNKHSGGRRTTPPASNRVAGFGRHTHLILGDSEVSGVHSSSGALDGTGGAPVLPATLLTRVALFHTFKNARLEEMTASK